MQRERKRIIARALQENVAEPSVGDIVCYCNSHSCLLLPLLKSMTACRQFLWATPRPVEQRDMPIKRVGRRKWGVESSTKKCGGSNKMKLLDNCS